MGWLQAVGEEHAEEVDEETSFGVVSGCQSRGKGEGRMYRCGTRERSGA